MNGDSAEKVFSKNDANFSLSIAPQSTFSAWLIIFVVSKFCEQGVFQQNQI